METMEELFFEAFEGMGRLGPGSGASTLKAVERFGRRGEPLKILDIGCGNGVQTLLLAEAYPEAEITAVDNHAPFIENLKREAERKGLGNRLAAVAADMGELDFPDSCFDLIWSEGAVYIIGFQRGIREWKRLLKPGGALVCSEVCWLTDTPSPEIAGFWQKEYPEIESIEAKQKKITAAGYRSHSGFGLPSSDWEGYYAALQSNLDRMRTLYRGDQTASEVIKILQDEIDLYHHYGNEYGYFFFVMFV
jgi:ubiquinone/menaquinone biosynthesis C-methylase UbiE